MVRQHGFEIKNLQALIAVLGVQLVNVTVWVDVYDVEVVVEDDVRVVVNQYNRNLASLSALELPLLESISSPGSSLR